MCGLACHAHCRGLTIKRKSLHLLSPRIQEGGFQRPRWIRLLDAGRTREDGSGGSRVDLLFETRAGGAARRYFEIAGVVSRPLELLGLLFCYQPIRLQQIAH